MVDLSWNAPPATNRSAGASPRPDEHYVHTRAYPAGPFMAGQLSPGPPLKIKKKSDSGRMFLFEFTH